MKIVCFFLVSCAILISASGNPQVFYKSLNGLLNPSARQYYAVEYLGSASQHPSPGQDYNLNHGEVDAPSEDDDDGNTENFSYNNGNLPIENNEETDSSIMPPTLPDSDSDEEDIDDTQVIVVGELPDGNNGGNGSLEVKANTTASSEELSATEESLVVEKTTENTIELETNDNSTMDKIIPAFVHPIHRPSSEWLLQATQLGTSKPKPDKNPIQKPQQDAEPFLSEEDPDKRVKPHGINWKRFKIIRRWGNRKRPNKIRIHRIQNRGLKSQSNRLLGRGISSTGSGSCGNCQCGITTTRRNSDGQVAAVNEQPWLTLITYNDTIQCTGTLIDDRHVLTAAHCVRGFDTKLFGLIFLEFNIKSSADTVSAKRKVTQIYSHKSYDVKTSDNDIAILKLSRPINFKTSTIRPICLPQSDEIDFTGKTGIVAGLGTATEKINPSNVLRKTEVPIISNEQCLLVDMKITNNMLCSGRLLDGGIDACQGESGGPLMVFQNKRYLLAGVISWGDGCVRSLKPGIYSRVTKYLPWINKRSTGACKCKK